MTEVIAFTCYNEGHVLVELRPPGNYYAPGELVFPGGHINPTDLSPIAAFYRELKEETGLKPDLFARLAPVKNFNQTITIFPFLLYGWTGKIPDSILDEGNPLYWKTLEIMQQSSLIEVATMANLIYVLTH